jgi:hypothetical protein
MSYLINVNTNELVAYTSKKLKSGELVLVAYKKCEESIDSSRKCNLVNSFTCKASNSKKWDHVDIRSYSFCEEIHENEFCIS